MSREIKFRAWDNSRNVMLYGTDIEETIDTYEDADGDEIEKNRYTEGFSCGSPFVAYYDDDEEWKECELMQFTGLHDRLGQEIYEGDVVRTVWDFGRSFGENICQVSFREGEFVFDVTYGTEWIRWESITIAEIIGNIYEHPHLISELPGR